MNKFALSHPTVKMNILRAFRNAQKWGVDHVRNKKGKAYLAIRYSKGKFTVVDKWGVNCHYLLRQIFIDLHFAWSFIANKTTNALENNLSWYSFNGRVFGSDRMKKHDSNMIA